MINPIISVLAINRNIFKIIPPEGLQILNCHNCFKKTNQQAELLNEQFPSVKTSKMSNK